MKMQILFAVMLIMVLNVYSESVTQTDWSGNSGIWWPVTSWGNEYYQDSDINTDYEGYINLIGTYTKHIIDSSFSGVTSIYAEDIDNDGDIDVLGSAMHADDITWWENVGGSGTIWIEHTIDANFDGAYSVHAEDINNDGYIDVLGAASDANDITWWENTDGSGTSWLEHTVDGDYNFAISVYSDDINGDGNMDVLGAARWDYDITWWENTDGSGINWIEHTIDGDFLGVNSVYSEDIDNDGDIDVLGAADIANGITWWQNTDGSGTYWIEHIIDGDFYASSVYAEDVNGDGYTDVLGTTLGADVITWWENVDGSGTDWIEHTIDDNFDHGWCVYAEDMDNDGDIDVLGAAGFDDHDIIWWENIDGFGTSWFEHIVDDSFIYASYVYAEDIDGDGYNEVLGAANIADDIVWWEVSAFYAPEGFLESSILDTGGDPQWASIDWTSYEPAGTDVYFKYRTSDQYQSMGAWWGPIYEPSNLSGLLDKYFQYKVIMETTDPNSTPTLLDVTLNWDLEGIEGDQPDCFVLFPFSPNPATGSISAAIAVPEFSEVQLLVYDATGRIVAVTFPAEYSIGYHQVQLDELGTGIYYCHMKADEFEAIRRFVIIR